MMYTMIYKNWSKYLLLFTFFISGFSVLSQENSEGILLDVQKKLEPASRQGVLSTIVKLRNTTDHHFSGILNWDVPNSLRAITEVSDSISLNPSDSLFLPVRFLVRNGVEAGSSSVNFRLKDNHNNILSEKSVSFVVEEKVQVNLVINSTNILVVDPNDSVRIKTIVGNRGNKTQNITVVFSIPDLTGQVNFVEQKATIAPMSQHEFIFSFLTSKKLLEKDRFVVNVVGMRGRDKEIFGNGSITIQNVLSNRKFNESSYDFGAFSLNQQNSITATYRRYGNSSDIFQLQGKADFNLPAGSMSVQGNMYSNLSQDHQVIATNTALTYRLDKNEFVVGNISESLDLSLFGRGAKMILSDEGQSKRLQVGVVDGMFNLFSSDALFKQVGSLYVIGQLGATNAKRQFYASYVYQDNSFDGAQYNVLAGEMRWNIRNAWYTRLKISGATSNYGKLDEYKTSGAVDFQYNGRAGDLELSGAYYYSSDYFPGTRRGVLSAQQSLIKGLGKGYSLRTNFLYSDFSPKYFYNTINSTYRNMNSEIEFRFPSFKSISASIAYQNQFERSNSYYLYFSAANPNIVEHISANRLVERLTWLSSNMKHTLTSIFENGIVKYPEDDKSHFQMKTSAVYSYKWLSLTASYQRGSYFISEYALKEDKEKPFDKLFLSGNVYKTFQDNKYELGGGATYSKDPLMGKAPSVFMNLKYNPNRSYSIFLNSSLYHYSLNNRYSQNVYNIEAGVSVHLPEENISTKRKSKVSVFVYYDKNANNVYDKGDEPASGFDFIINNIAFLSDDNGEFVYTQVPFGAYEIKPISRRGWFYKGQPLVVTKYKTKIQIPLQQTGTLSGKIDYEFDKKTTMDMILKYSNIRFRIVNVDNEVVYRPVTTDDGTFLTFLPTGDYKIILEQNSLEQNTFCEQPEQSFTIRAGKIIDLPTFHIGVKHRKVNMKRFSDNSESNPGK